MTNSAQIASLSIPDVKLLAPKRFRDERGFFCETYRKKDFADAGLVFDFVQDNHSLSVQRGTVRGLHYQIPPHAQTKLVRVVRGAIFDVAVDLRRSSPTFGLHVSATLSADEGNQILIPRGFAHGFCTLEANTEVIYKVDDYWSQACERGILWSDPQLRIAWPFSPAETRLSEKDLGYPLFAQAVDLFD